MFALKSTEVVCCSSSRQVLPSAARGRGAFSSRLSSKAVWQQQCSTRQAAPARQQRAQVQLARALKDEDAEIDRMAREASQTDIWGNELVGNLVKVGIVGAVVAVVLIISSLAKPLYENTIRSFPTPAEYEQYEQREEEVEGGF